MNIDDILKVRNASDANQWYGSKMLSAKNRYENGYFDIYVRPKFRIDKKLPVFTIGSCFARNIESALLSMGFAVPISGLSVEQKYYASQYTLKNAILNVYNVKSIEDRVIGFLADDYKDEQYIYDAGGGKFWHSLLTHVKPNENRVIERLSDIARSATRSILSSGTVIVTLGLNEVWLDVDRNIYLNLMPPVPVIKNYPDRFDVVSPSVESNIDSLTRFVDYVYGITGGRCRFVITVSPVPLAETFLHGDVVVANSQSKSTLRHVAGLVASKYDYVDYFPSFEMVMNSPRSIAWEDDQAHVRQEMVNFVVKKFIDNYAA